MHVRQRQPGATLLWDWCSSTSATTAGTKTSCASVSAGLKRSGLRKSRTIGARPAGHASHHAQRSAATEIQRKSGTDSSEGAIIECASRGEIKSAARCSRYAPKEVHRQPVAETYRQLPGNIR